MDRHVLIVAPPGAGKTMYARKHSGFCGKPIESARARTYIYRVCGLPHPGDTAAPFRAPHHTAHLKALRGELVDGYIWRPGEFSLAHGGTLFLDELPEFRSDCIEALREPLLSGSVTYTGSGSKLQVPAQFRLIAAAMPCPCGWFGSGFRDCTCSKERIGRYRRRIPDWLRDRCEILSFDNGEFR